MSSPVLLEAMFVWQFSADGKLTVAYATCASHMGLNHKLPMTTKAF